MLETPHVIVAAAIAYKIGNPALVLPLSFGSHFVLERVPHWNPHLNREKKKYGHLTPKTQKIIFIDSFVALAIGTLVATSVLPNVSRSFLIVLACFLSVLPDILEAPYFFFNHQNRFMMKFHKFQKSIQSDASIIPGLTLQAATALAAFFWILH